MAQVYDLLHPGHFGEQTKRLLGAEVIEGLQNVVGHEWHRAMLVDELEIADDTQREIELEARALRHLGSDLRVAPRIVRSGYALHSRLPHILWLAGPPAA